MTSETGSLLECGQPDLQPLLGRPGRVPTAGALTLLHSARVLRVHEDSSGQCSAQPSSESLRSPDSADLQIRRDVWSGLRLRAPTDIECSTQPTSRILASQQSTF